MKVIEITKEGYRRNLFLAVSLTILITGCSPSQVNQHTKNSSGFLAADGATCRQKATALIDRELKLDSSYDSKLRLAEMGVMPGVDIRMIKKTPFGGPVQVKINNYYLTLRKEDGTESLGCKIQ